MDLNLDLKRFLVCAALALLVISGIVRVIQPI